MGARVTGYYDGSTVLITGGSGSLGRALTRQLLQTGVKCVRLISRNEHRMAEAMALFPGDGRLRPFLGDVCDRDRLLDAMRGCDTVIHCAAQKRIESCDYDPRQCKETNVDGVETAMWAARQVGVRSFMFISTDKAAGDPITFYGASKRLAEGLVLREHGYDRSGVTRYSVCRYGNVASSQGSVIPIFQEQAKRGGPLTITDREMTRFLWTLSEAAAFVLGCLPKMHGCEIFVPRLPSARITDLAEAVAPGMPTTVIGLRAHEKLHEVLMSEDESRRACEHDGAYVIGCGCGCHTVAVPFEYNSGNNGERLSVERLRAMLEAN